MRNLLGDRWDGPFKLSHVELLSAGLERLSEFPFDIILLDLSLPDSQGLETFFTMHAQAATCRSWCSRAITTNRRR